ncbi:MAG TPA: DUF2252 family protein [Polyangiaceae bacterium]|jgi:uncharacterized protein (DUF2252 family)
MLAVDPLVLARRQIAHDRERTERFPELFDRKLARMTASPLAFLRGAAPLFYELLAAHPAVAEGPRGKGWIAGDLHLENFGAYRPLPLVPGAAKGGRRDVAFDLNDFDDAVIGPWRLDVLRLTTSLILGGRELGAGGRRVLDLAHELLAAYVRAAFSTGKDRAREGHEPAPVARLVAQVAGRSRKELLEARTEVVKGKRRFVRGDRYADLPRAIAKRVPQAFAEYVKGLPEEVQQRAGHLEVLDAAWRIAGTGSLGGLRVAVLARPKEEKDEDHTWVFDMKEQGRPSATAFLGRPAKKWRLTPAVRVATAFEACVARPPRLVGTSSLDGVPLFVRRLAPQEDKLDLSTLADADLDPLADYLGALVGRAHARGATKAPPRPWSHAECGTLIDHAIAVAGIHEAAYLALCKLAGAPARRKRS